MRKRQGAFDDECRGRGKYGTYTYTLGVQQGENGIERTKENEEREREAFWKIEKRKILNIFILI